MGAAPTHRHPHGQRGGVAMHAHRHKIALAERGEAVWREAHALGRRRGRGRGGVEGGGRAVDGMGVRRREGERGGSGASSTQKAPWVRYKEGGGTKSVGGDVAM